jgi:DNA-binding MarR family transcriptional regulator
MDAKLADLAEELRASVSLFVQTVRYDTDTPRSAKSDTLDLLDRDGPSNIADLAEIRKVKHQSMRLVTAQLEEEGLIERAPDGGDRRSVLFGLTAKGKAWLDAERGKRTARIADMIAARLPAAERAQLRVAAGLLRRLAEDQAP